jgi:general secretion pathway protein A
LLQVVLVGQPELDEKLDSVGLRQLKQRIALRARLGALDWNETKGYIERRLQVASTGADTSKVFPEESVSAVFRHSRGCPRLINTLCENALITAYARQMHTITPGIIDDVAKDFRLDVPFSSEANGILGSDRIGLREKTNIPEFYSGLPISMGTESDSDTPVAIRASKHEPYI